MAKAKPKASVSGFSSKVNKRHFHTFDALRFLAFFKVFLLHLPIVAFPWFNYLRAGGGIGVQFFFVLSGFLITYIIYEEKLNTGTLNLKKFFMRRILRIWPLYYLMILVAFLTPYILSQFHLNSSAEGYQPNWLMSMLFLENYKMMATHSYPNVSPLSVMWSLCIEEHFYIIWGLALFFIKLKNLPKMILACVVIGLIGRVVYVNLGIPTSDIVTNIDLFAFGGIPAYILLAKEEVINNKLGMLPKYFKWIYVTAVVFIVLIASQFVEERYFVWLTTVLGALFCGLILLTLPTTNRIYVKDTSWLSKVGVYTYGLYLYHTLVLNFLRQVFLKYNLNTDEPEIAMLFICISLIATLAISILSYYIYEKPFLRLKKYFR